MAVVEWLIDTSALVRLSTCLDPAEWIGRIDRGLVHISTVTRLEVGFAARSGGDIRSVMARPPMSAFIVEHLTPAIEDRALDVMMLLADRGQHRAPSIPDLLVAATAERLQLTVLHVDKDFEVIASVTGQVVERLRT